MNVETGGSMAGTASSGASSVAISSPAEAGTSSIDSGMGSFQDAPSFSGLQNDFVNEGPVGPVSFTNSIDLFAETKSFTPTFTVNEDPVKSDVFNKSTIIAKSSTTPSVSIPNAESMPDNIVPQDVYIAVDPKINSQKETYVASEIPFIEDSPEEIPLIETDTTIVEVDSNPENLANILTEAEPFSNISVDTIIGTLDELKTDDPITYQQLKSDLKSTEVIMELLDEIPMDPKTATSIANSAIETTVKRSGLIEEIKTHEETEDSDDKEMDQNKAEDNPDKQKRTTNTQQAVTKPREKYIRDEEANSKRAENAKKAAIKAIDDAKENSQTSIKGKQIVKNMNIHPSNEEISEYAKDAGLDDDGSFQGVIKDLKGQEFDTYEELRNAIQQAINKNTGVKKGESGTSVTEPEKAKVLQVKN